MACDVCFGTGLVLEHAEDCADDQCALNGDQHDCAGLLLPCACVHGRRRELPPALRRCPWLAHPESQRTHFVDQRPARRRLPRGGVHG